MVLTPAKIRRELAKISFSTAHARDIKNNTIAHLLTYERSVASGGEIDLSALFAVCGYLVWLSDHVREINDKQVLPSERQALAQAYEVLFGLYHQQKTI